MFMILLIILILIVVVSGRSGVDLSVYTDANQWDCLINDHNVSYAIIRLYRNIGSIDSNAVNSINEIYKISSSSLLSGNIDGYMFPCISSSSYSISNNIQCPSASIQVLETIKHLNENNIFINNNNNSKKQLNRIYIDIEDEVPSKYFDSNPTVNQKFIADMIEELKRNDIPYGIYSTSTYWSNIMGNIVDDVYKNVPLWYPRYDGYNNLTFFKPFANWETVQIKQTNGDVGYCNITQVDSNYSDI